MRKKLHKSLKKYSVLPLVGVIVFVGVVYAMTKHTKSVTPVAVVPPPPVPLIETPSPTPVEHKTDFHNITVTTDKPGGEISALVGLSNVPFVLAFNRLDAGHIRTNTTIVIPPQYTDWDALSPFPEQLDVATDIDKLFLVSQRVQAFAAYEHGVRVRWGTVSTGKADTPTPSKLYFTNWKGKSVISSVDDEWTLPWYFNLDNAGGVSMHQYDLPGYPASHSCVRMSATDAEWVYNWADQWILSPTDQKLASGTPVIVFGEYAYGKTAPWKKLATDPDASTLTTDELTELIQTNIATITAEAANRVAVVSH